MAITLNGTTGITTPADTITGNATVGGTLAVTGATTVGGVAVVAVAPSTAGNVLTSNGSAWTSAAPSGGQIQVFITGSSTTWTCPAGVTKILVTCVGGGSGGVVNSYNEQFGTGGYGGVCIALVTVSPGTVYTITIGAGGAGTTGNMSGTITGTTGGTTTFESLVTATGATAATASGFANTHTDGANGSGSTTGTLIRSGPSGILSGYMSGGGYPLSAPAVVWTTSTSFGAGTFGNTSGGLGTGFGAVGGGVSIQYVG